jgi:DNA-binding SARP family transcriptional activator
MVASLSLLGGLNVRLGDGAPLDLPTQKYKALLAYLAMPPGQSHPREKLVALLWGDLARAQGRAALRYAVWTLRRALDRAGPSLLNLGSDAIALNADAIEVDVAAFERACASSDMASLQRAAALYRGDFLAGLGAREEPFEEWLAQQRERLAELALGALARLFAQQRKTGLFEEAIQTALRLIAIDPLQEPIHRALMELYVQLDRRPAALRHYRTFAQTFQRELGIDPGVETQTLYQTIVAQRLPSGEPSRASHSAVSEEVADTPFATSAPKITDDGPMVGRSHELSLLEQALAETAGGRGQVAVVFGEAGIGKSRLVAAVAANAAERGFRVLLGHCYESEQVLTFGPWINAFAQGTIDEDKATIDKMRPKLRAAFTHLAPHVTHAETERGESDYRLIFEAVTQLLSARAARQPLVLILEDVHWADGMSLRLFAFIARRAQHWPLLLVFTARPEEIDEAPLLSRTLDDLDRDLAVLQLSLAPLTRDDTAQLVAALAERVSAQSELSLLSERIWTLSEGNPFMIVETLRALRDEPGIDVQADIALPERVRRVVGRRLDRLAPTARQLMTTAAVIGRDFSFPLLQRASELSEAEALTGLEQLVRRGLLCETGDRFDVSHDSIRRTAVDALLPPRRRLLHQRVAETIEALHAADLSPHLAALGYHYVEAEIWDRAAGYLDRVGRRGLVHGAYREGIIALKQVLGAIPRMPESRAATELAFDIHVNLLPLLQFTGDMDAMAEHIRAAAQIAAKLEDKYRDCHLYIFTSQYHRATRDHAGAAAIARTALALADALDNQYLRDHAYLRLGLACHSAGDYQHAIEYYEIPVARRNLAVYEVPIARISDPQERSTLRHLPSFHASANALVTALCDVGRYDDARRHAEDAQRAADDHSPRIAWAPWSCGWQRAHQGHLEESIEPLEHAVELMREQQFHIVLPQAIAALALAFALLGRAEDAARLLDGSGTDLLPVKIPIREPFVFPLLAKALWFTNRVSEAREYAERALRGAVEFGEPSNEAEARLVLAMIGVGAREWDDDRQQQTLEHLRIGRTLAERLGMKPLLAHCHYYNSIALKRAGLEDESRAEHESATDLYRIMDMRFWLARAEASTTTKEPRPSTGISA